MKNKNIVYVVILIIILIIFNAGFFNLFFRDSKSEETTNDEYNPIINPLVFISVVNNKYFTLIPGTKYVYEAQTEEGKEHIEVYVTNDRKEVLGVSTIVVWDRVWLDGNLIEDTKDWYAQDKQGNVWYFGEESKELIDGKIISYEGSWEAGIDGAKPGIVMKADPKIGDIYRQEYYPGKAEDMGQILALEERVTIPYGILNNCLKTKDWNPLELGDEEYKYYCPDVNFVVLEVGIEDGERVELITIERDSEPSPSIVPEVQEIKTKITEEQAKEIALKRIPGKITNFALEKKFGKITFVVEIAADNGPETDVIIDIDTGEILGIET